MICKVCQKDLPLDHFHYKHGIGFPICKACINHLVDPEKEETYLWLLAWMDIPYSKNQWQHFAQAYEKPFARYLAWSKLAAYQDFTFQDSGQFYQNELDKIAQQGINNFNSRYKDYEI